jgi:hypothetical protein
MDYEAVLKIARTLQLIEQADNEDNKTARDGLILQVVGLCMIFGWESGIRVITSMFENPIQLAWVILPVSDRESKEVYWQIGDGKTFDNHLNYDITHRFIRLVAK